MPPTQGGAHIHKFNVLWASVAKLRDTETPFGKSAMNWFSSHFALSFKIQISYNFTNPLTWYLQCLRINLGSYNTTKSGRGGRKTISVCFLKDVINKKQLHPQAVEEAEAMILFCCTDWMRFTMVEAVRKLGWDKSRRVVTATFKRGTDGIYRHSASSALFSFSNKTHW